jgi:hypothetical protein
LWSEGNWLDDYLRRRIEAARTTNDVVEPSLLPAQRDWRKRATPLGSRYTSGRTRD